MILIHVVVVQQYGTKLKHHFSSLLHVLISTEPYRVVTQPHTGHGSQYIRMDRAMDYNIKLHLGETYPEDGLSICAQLIGLRMYTVKLAGWLQRELRPMLQLVFQKLRRS